MRKSILLLALLMAILGPFSFGQADRRDVRRGNKLYRSEKFNEAEINYRKALQENSQNRTGLFNLGNSLYKQGRFEEAAQVFESIAQTSQNVTEKAQAFHNLGNSQLKGEKIKESIEAYKNSLRLNPKDNETRHNLAYALRLLQEQPPQDGDGDNDQNEDKDQDQKESGQDENQQDQQQKQQQQPGQISPQDAERILNALNQKEQKIQEELNKEQQQRNQSRPQREW